MKPRVLAFLCLLLTIQSYANDYYWVGGAGNWSDLNHWRIGSSSGPIAGIIPSAADNVFFDANSGFGATPATSTVTLNANGFCNNISWLNVPNAPSFVTSSGSFRLEVWGNAVLSPVTTYWVAFAFKGASANTLKTNGPVLGNFSVIVEKATGGKVTVTDSLVQTSSIGILLTSGTFDIAGKKVLANSFQSNNNNVRTLDMTNASMTIAGTGDFQFNGTNKTLLATGSYMESYVLVIDGGTYNKVVCRGGTGFNQLTIHNSTFSTLTFSEVLGTLAAINNGNTVSDSLIFMGMGNIGNNNNIGYLYYSKRGDVSGANNVIRKIECRDMLQFWTGLNLTHVNTVDSLLLAPNRLTYLDGTLNINKYLYLQGAPCDAFSEINGDSTNGAVNFAAGAVVNINNAIITGVKAAGPVTPIPVMGFDGGENRGFAFTEPSNVAGTTLYWVGGPGDWNDRSHWSTSSGGPGGACIPFINDDVIFNANSGLASGTVTTSSSSFCRNMTWTGVGTVTFNESASSFNIYGSLVMAPSVTMNALIEFKGSNPASITTNGTTTGSLQFLIAKSNGAVVTLSDNWNNPTGGSFVHRSGGLNLGGRTVDLFYYSSAVNDAARSVDISNAILNFVDRWDYTGNIKTITSTGSHITTAILVTDGLSYPWVDVTSSSFASIISGTTFGQLTFTNPSATSPAGIGISNTIRRLEFKGKGAVNGGGNNIDTLILAGSRNYTFAGTNTINKNFKAQSTACTGLTEIRGNPTGTLAFAGGATVQIDNVYMQNMTATGQNPAFSGADAGGNSGWTINVATGGPRYWVGGSGDWNDASHWSTSSGGPGGACIPTVADNVFFDNKSFSSGSSTVTINNGNAYCANMDWTGAAFAPVFNKSTSFNLEIWGNLVMNPAVTMNTPYVSNGAPILMFTGPANSTLTSNGAGLGDFDFAVSKPNGSTLTLTDNYNNANTGMDLRSGGLDLSNRTLTVHYLSGFNSGSSPTDLSITNTTFNGWWDYRGAGKSLQAANSQIKASSFMTDHGTYNKVDVTTTSSASVIISGTTIDSLIFSYPDPVSQANIGANNTINLLEFKGGGAILGTGNIIDTLVFFPGSTYQLASGSNTTITGEWYGSGTPCRPTEIFSSSTGSNATITKNSGTVEFDYVRLRNITAAGSAQPFIAHEHSNDLGGNLNWNIDPYNGSTPITGLGPDYAIFDEDFPDTLTTAGFFGSPSSTYLWNDGSTNDSLVITGPGTYSVSASLADGCVINDEIVVGSLGTLPITITSFTATVRDCQARLNWKVEDAVRFSHFVVEKSNDGRNYTEVDHVIYTSSVGNYSFNDANLSSGVTHYRLKLVDIDGSHEYSTVASVRSDCGTLEIQVRPTFTHNNVQLVLPAGFEKARLYIINTMGQQYAPVVSGNGTVRTVSLQGLPAATYILQVINGADVRTFKIVKQ